MSGCCSISIFSPSEAVTSTVEITSICLSQCFGASTLKSERKIKMLGYSPPQFRVTMARRSVEFLVLLYR